MGYNVNRNFLNQCVPKECTILRFTMNTAADYSQAKWYCLHKHVVARLASVAVPVIALVNVPRFGISAILTASVAIIKFDGDKFQDYLKDADSALKCASVFLLTTTLLITSLAATLVLQGYRVLKLLEVSDDDYQSKYEKLQICRDNLKAAQKYAQKIRRAQDSDISEISSKLRAANLELGKLKTNIGNLNTSLASANEEKKQLGSTIEKSNGEKQQLNTKIDELDKLLSKANDEKKVLEGKVDELNLSLEGVNEEKKQLKELISQETEKATEAIGKLNEELIAVKKALEEATTKGNKDFATLQSQFVALQSGTFETIEQASVSVLLESAILEVQKMPPPPPPLPALTSSSEKRAQAVTPPKTSSPPESRPSISADTLQNVKLGPTRKDLIWNAKDLPVPGKTTAAFVKKEAESLMEAIDHLKKMNEKVEAKKKEHENGVDVDLCELLQEMKFEKPEYNDDCFWGEEEPTDLANISSLQSIFPRLEHNKDPIKFFSYYTDWATNRQKTIENSLKYLRDECGVAQRQQGLAEARARRDNENEEALKQQEAEKKAKIRQQQDEYEKKQGIWDGLTRVQRESVLKKEKVMGFGPKSPTVPKVITLEALELAKEISHAVNGS